MLLRALAGWLLCVASVASATDSPLAVTHLRTESCETPLGIDSTAPRFSWRLEAEAPNVMQAAYQVLVATEPSKLTPKQADLWNSGWISTTRSTGITYAGKPLAARQRGFWSVRIGTKSGSETKWAEPTWFELGLLQGEDWTARWIGMDPVARGANAPWFRKVLEVKRPLKHARIYSCGLGYYELYVNGAKVSDRVLHPGQTDYESRAFTTTDDVTRELKVGQNCIGLWLGDGWYNQDRVWAEQKLAYGPPRGIVQLELTHQDGSREIIGSGADWKSATSPILSSNIYAGELFDARRDDPRWSLAEFDDSTWKPAVEIKGPGGRLVSQLPCPPIRMVEELPTKHLTQIASDLWLYDFGQNFAGWCQLKVSSEPGTEIELSFGEKKSPNGRVDHSTGGEMHTKVRQIDRYICRGDGEEVWQPRFTYHGFQFAELRVVSGKLKAPPTKESLLGKVVHTDTRPVGNFACSDRMLERIHTMARWTQRSNMHSVPTDCPIRERCGWTGDAHHTTPMTLYNFDAATYWEKYLADMQTSGAAEAETTFFNQGFNDQRPATKPAMIPYMIAPGRRKCGGACPDFGSAIVLIPWQCYLFTGDETTLTRCYPAMQAWTDWLLTLAAPHDGLVVDGLGDWCATTFVVDLEDRIDPNWIGNREIPITSTVYLVRCLETMRATAEVLGKLEDAQQYADQLAATKATYIKAFLAEQKMPLTSQASLALTLRHGLAPPTQHEQLRERLRSAVADADGKFTTGIIGTPHVFNVLAEQGDDQLAHQMLIDPRAPGYAALLDWGATTLWEVWTKSYEENIRSMSHPMQGGFAHFFYSALGGLQPLASHPGFERFVLRPELTAEVEFAKIDYESVRGTIRSDWRVSDGAFRWQIVAPPNSMVEAMLPSANIEGVELNGQPLTPERIELRATAEGPRATIELGSGAWVLTQPIASTSAAERN